MTQCIAMQKCDHGNMRLILWHSINYALIVISTFEQQGCQSAQALESNMGQVTTKFKKRLKDVLLDILNLQLTIFKIIV